MISLCWESRRTAGESPASRRAAAAGLPPLEAARATLPHCECEGERASGPPALQVWAGAFVNGMKVTYERGSVLVSTQEVRRCLPQSAAPHPHVPPPTIPPLPRPADQGSRHPPQVIGMAAPPHHWENLDLRPGEEIASVDLRISQRRVEWLSIRTTLGRAAAFGRGAEGPTQRLEARGPTDLGGAAAHCVQWQAPDPGGAAAGAGRPQAGGVPRGRGRPGGRRGGGSADPGLILPTARVPKCLLRPDGGPGRCSALRELSRVAAPAADRVSCAPAAHLGARHARERRLAQQAELVRPA